MKIRDLLGEDGVQAVIKDYKPGQTLSMVDPATDTMTVVDLKKNPTAVATDAEGNLTYDPTPDAGGATPGASAPTPKPGDKVNIDVTAAEDLDSDVELADEPADEILRIRDLAGISESNIEDLGDGAQKKTYPDGTYEIGDGSGLKLYSPKGKLLKIISPTFNGFTQETDVATGDVTQRSQQGHMDITQVKDKKGKIVSTDAKADLGLGVAGYAKDDRKGVTTKTWSPRSSEEDPVTQKDMYAMGNKDKEDTYDRAMKQVATDKIELESILKIAGLR